MSTSSPPPRALSRLAVAAVLWCSAWQAMAANPVDVGQVSLLIGQAWVVRADGTQQPLQRGSAIRVGDRVETAANGHVHMRFIDNAAVSVRPESVLHVQAYQYDAQNPKSNEVRLRVDKGVSRSISGAATDLDKTRFRLNTPIAAIGVRGTDFIVQTGPTGVRATVSDGTIIVSALGGNCMAAGLGPCAGNDVRELSAEMGRLMAEVRPGDRATHIVPAADLSLAQALVGYDGRLPGQSVALSAARATGMLAAEPTAAEVQRGNNRAAAGMLGISSVSADVQLGNNAAAGGVLGGASFSSTEIQRGNDLAAADLVALAQTSVPDLNRRLSRDQVGASALGGSDGGSALVWGRWAILPAATDKVSVPFSAARVGREITVADDYVGLFRAKSGEGSDQIAEGLGGRVELRLSRASASFEVGTRSESASVSASNLTIDFSRRTFATGLDLLSASGVKGELRMAGELRPDGIFAVRDADQRVSGAITLDGKEAGYLFDRSAGGGLFRGRTLWGQ